MKKKHIHFVGIKGVGMTALAIYAKEKGYFVTGSDVDEEFVTDFMLNKFKIPVASGFEKFDKNFHPDLAIVTGAHGGMTNPEAISLSLAGVEVITHGQALGRFMKGTLGISVAGVGGKTTVSAMAATVLTQAGLQPSYAVGVGSINPLGQPGHYGQSKYFIVEADEYASCPKTDLTPRFLYQEPTIEIITNIEYDHPDLYKTFEDTKTAFTSFINKLPQNDGLLIINKDNANNNKMLASIARKFITYGFSGDADYQIERIRFSEGQTYFTVKNGNLKLGDFTIKTPGKFNALNALSVIILGIQLGIPVARLQRLVPEFLGTKRRFEFIGEKNCIKLYDDYAHHPNEIQMTLMAIRQWFPKTKIICIFQPHTYSRTKALLPQFARSFGFADRAFILPIFSSAREVEDLSINSSILTCEISKFHPQTTYVSNNNILLDSLGKELDNNSLIITMGAGDIYKLDDQIMEIIKTNN